MGDAILQLLGLPEDSHLPPCGITEESDFERFKRTVYQYLPGSVGLAKSKLFCKCLFSRDREHLKKYIYFDWFYPHHREVSKTFASLLRLYDTDCLEQ